MRRIIIFIFLIVSIGEIQSMISGCAQIMAPTGGTRDTLPPVLVSVNPKQPAINFSGNRINLYFDEYVQIQ
ncbi:MAG: Ig-like domain-containing protein, partial [Ginsengibacter sp.]